ncbi:MAG: hypothetical protein QM704_22195 [Anaeromyxobacteraceae bacterium]
MPRRPAQRAQRDLPFRSHGGRRPGAGRPRNPERVSHVRRPRITRNFPAHVTLRTVDGLPSLRGPEPFAVVVRALEGLRERSGARVVHFVVISNHLHLVVEATSPEALSRTIQGLSVRIARGLNAALGRSGAVFRDRHHVRLLKTPREVRNALVYVLQNARRHTPKQADRIVDPTWIDPRSSGRWFDGWRHVDPEPGGDRFVAPAQSWLLSTGWRRHGLLEVDETPVGGG